MTTHTRPAGFVVLPAIDLRHGQVVRLTQGRDDARTEYSDDPAAMAASFVEAGAEILHVVDLDAAFGDGDNRAAIAAICGTVDVPVQVGGGVRDDDAVDALLSLGVHRVIVGSAAVENPDLVSRLVDRFGERIVVGIDALDGDVKLRGWVEGSARSAVDVGRDMAARGVREVVYTNIAQDGTLAGPDVASSLALAEATGLSVIVSGGVGDASHITAVAQAAGDVLGGVIVGKAIYEGRVTVRAAIEAGQC